MTTFIDRADVAVLSRGTGHIVGAVTKSTSGLIQESGLIGFFDGVNTVLDYLAREMPHPGREKSSSRRNDGSGFNSFDTYEQAFSAYRDNPRSVRQFVEADLELTDADSAGIAVEYGVTGDYLDVGRFLEGEPEAFGIMANGNPRGRRVNILLTVNAVFDLDVEAINARGRRLQRLVDWLEARQVRTAITAISSNQCAHVEIAVKHHDEQLDLNDVAVVGHGDFLRRMMFRFREYSETWQEGYGSAYTFSEYLESSKLKFDDSHELTVIVGNYMHDSRHVDKEFDKAELDLVEALSSSWIEDRQRVVRLFRER